MPLPSNRRDASKVFSGDGCTARVSPAGAKVVAEKAERNGGKPACVASERARNAKEEASVVVSSEPREDAPALTEIELAICGDACGSKIHWLAKPSGNEAAGAGT